jgi:parallel beta-helix repeat protein
MTKSAHRAIALVLLLAGPSVAGRAEAAQSYDSCTGFIESVPATIASQGTWCLRRDLSTSINSGVAISIATNNVTIDCNGFKLGGLAAGDDSIAIGIEATSRQNATVRNCNVRGFLAGIRLGGGAGHLVEGNRLDNNLGAGIIVQAANSRILRNAVYDTGGYAGALVIGIEGSGEVTANTVSGLYTRVPGTLVGIRVHGSGSLARDNTVSGFDMLAGTGAPNLAAFGIQAWGARTRVSGNHIDSLGTAVIGAGIDVATVGYCIGNTVGGFAAGIHPDCLDGGNLVSP